MKRLSRVLSTAGRRNEDVPVTFPTPERDAAHLPPPPLATERSCA
ncbi:MAG: hypothetical protein ACI4X9_04020 [Kiritimatiellia bacterium]